jgi:hypothetical protein
MAASGIEMKDGLAELDDRPDGLTKDSVLETTDCKRSVLSRGSSRRCIPPVSRVGCIAGRTTNP